MFAIERFTGFDEADAVGSNDNLQAEDARAAKLAAYLARVDQDRNGKGGSEVDLSSPSSKVCTRASASFSATNMSTLIALSSTYPCIEAITWKEGRQE